ncbi:hypothetical protein GCM10010279_32320 [Streptomyces mutabilis]|nr:hypothetical protein GCM10010279_32320 [Streptomyces mutabilis]
MTSQWLVSGSAVYHGMKKLQTVKGSRRAMPKIKRFSAVGYESGYRPPAALPTGSARVRP